MNTSSFNRSVHCAVLLAGGLSSRMGDDKALLKRGSETLLDYGVRQLKATKSNQVYISRNEPGFLNDCYRNFGPISGIHACLMALAESEQQFLTILPVDMPLMTSEQIVSLQDAAEQHQLPVYFEPSVLPAVIPVTVEIKQYFQTVVEGHESAALWRFMKKFNGVSINCENNNLLVNTNTPTEWQAFEQTYRGYYGT